MNATRSLPLVLRHQYIFRVIPSASFPYRSFEVIIIFRKICCIRIDGSAGHFGKLQTICRRSIWHKTKIGVHVERPENFKWQQNATLFTNDLAFICALACRKQFNMSACRITIIIRVNGYIINIDRYSTRYFAFASTTHRCSRKM